VEDPFLTATIAEDGGYSLSDFEEESNPLSRRNGAQLTALKKSKRRNDSLEATVSMRVKKNQSPQQ